MFGACYKFSPPNEHCAAQQQRRVDDAALKDAGKNGEDWISYNMNWSEQRYSPLNQVNASNVTKDYAHDIKAMVNADPNAGVLYICSPNNPTGTITRREEIEYALAKLWNRDVADKAVAECLMTGLITDTGSFRFLNVTPRTFQLAARLQQLGAIPAPITERVFENKSYASVHLGGILKFGGDGGNTPAPTPDPFGGF